MDKRAKTYLYIFGAGLMAMLFLQYNAPKKINWFKSYVGTHKIPYGTYVFNTLLKEKFPERTVQVHTSPFLFVNRTEAPRGTYVFANGSVSFDKAELDALLNWTAQGNTLFVASKGFDAQLTDTLNLEVNSVYGGFEAIQKQSVQWLHPNLKVPDSVIFDRDTYALYWQWGDSTAVTPLGTVQPMEEGRSEKPANYHNVVQRPFGKGNIVLSTFPEAFTNYFVLQGDNKDYVAGLMAHLGNNETIFMDNHHKSGKAFYTSPMHVFLNNKALKWAYYIALVGVVLYILFQGKRKQRAIPVVPTPQNRTLAFTRTIADMYFEKGDQKNSAEHRINHFMEHLRQSYYLGNIGDEEGFYKNIASRSGHSQAWVAQFFGFMEALRNSDSVTDAQLMELNKKIDTFKSGTNGRQ
ncbi:DUF4350 domain-containing protein [Maribacter sp. 2307ULW6-5]|uniref:DUF4350 domain-containing protein n=1 Tax=Maribacter sp. 2307ULW6-5 TaxID=3386275 RepID=UPI0039BD3D92